jgi:16S rRNA (adenine1518-N6/adenine1519-N6)-dimethyltransferase
MSTQREQVRWSSHWLALRAPNTMQPATRQTQSYLRTLFSERGLRPKNKLGQNFLIDLNLLGLIVNTAELSRADLALEVGSGTGGLTVRLIELAGAVVSVEIDPAFAALTDEAVAAHFGPDWSTRPADAPLPERAAASTPHVRLLQADVLKTKNDLNPELLRQICELLDLSKAERVKLVANLPYAVAVPVISNLLLSDLPVECMVVTVQWEIAERLTAALRSKGYGALAVLVQSLADVTLVRRLPPTVFWPRPQVASAIVLVRPSAAKRSKVIDACGNVAALRNFLRDLYAHRRKNLRGALAGRPSGGRDKQEVDRKLTELCLDGMARAESLDLGQHLRLCRVFG